MRRISSEHAVLHPTSCAQPSYLQLQHLSRRRQERQSPDRVGSGYHIARRGRGRVLFANEAAEKILRKQDGLTAANRVLHAHDAVLIALHDVVAVLAQSPTDAAMRRAGDVVIPRDGRRPAAVVRQRRSVRGAGEVVSPQDQSTAIVVANDPEQQTGQGSRLRSAVHTA